MLVCHVPDDAQIAPSATGVQTPLLHTLCSTQLSALNTASSGLNISVNVAQEAPHRVPKQLCRSATVLTLLTCCVTAAAIGHTNHTLSDVLCHIHTGAAGSGVGKTLNSNDNGGGVAHHVGAHTVNCTIKA